MISGTAAVIQEQGLAMRGGWSRVRRRWGGDVIAGREDGGAHGGLVEGGGHRGGSGLRCCGMVGYLNQLSSLLKLVACG